jgi:hypothetical protein
MIVGRARWSGGRAGRGRRGVESEERGGAKPRRLRQGRYGLSEQMEKAGAERLREGSV